MNKRISKYTMLLLASVLCSCTALNFPGNTVSLNNKVPAEQEKSGASITVRIDFAKSPFAAKANLINIDPLKTPADIDKYYIYLVKNLNTSAYPLNGDPLGAADLVSGPLVITNDGQPVRDIVINDVPVLPTGAYYVAVKAQDAGAADLIKVNDGRTIAGQLWTGTTTASPHNGRVSVSSGQGITVDSSYIVSPTASLSVTPHLDSVGAIIGANISAEGGDNLDFSVVSKISIVTIAGTSASSGSTLLNNPAGVAVDSTGNVYIADTTNHRIRKLDKATGVISTIAGSGIACPSPTSGCGDGGSATSTNVRFNSPGGLAVDSSGNVYIADTSDHRVRKLDKLTGNISTVAGSGTACPNPTTACGDGASATSTNARLNFPSAVAVDSSFNIYIADTSDNKIRKVDNITGFISTIAGTGAQGNASVTVSAPATSVQLNSPGGIAVSSTASNIYIANTGNHTIRKITSGTMTNFAGDGTVGTADNGIATTTQLSSPAGVALDTSGNVYIADTTHNLIRKASSTGSIYIIAGTSAAPLNNGVPTTTQLNNPKGVAVDSAGNVYIANTSDHTIRKLIYE
jgi:sugar lactone lactonase YvrE